MVERLLEYAFIGAGSVWMIRQAFFNKPGAFLSWPMFNFVTYYWMEIVDQSGLRIEHLKYRIHIDYGGGRDELSNLLLYLREVHGIYAEGAAFVIGRDGVAEFKVHNGELVY